MLYPTSGSISMQGAISVIQLLRCSLRLHCLFNGIAELHFVVVILQDLLYLQSVLVPAEGFKRFSQTVHSMVIGDIYAVAQVAKSLLLVTTEGASLVGQLNVQSFSHSLSVHVLSCDECLLRTPQFFFFYSFQLFDGFGASVLVEVYSQFQFLAIGVIFVGPFLLPPIWSQFAQQSCILSVSQLTRCPNLMHIVLNLLQYFSILGLRLTLQPIRQVLLPDSLHQLEILSHLFLIPLEISLPFLFLLLACLQQLFFQFQSYLSLECYYLGQQPLDGDAVVIEGGDVSAVCLCVFARVQLKKQSQQQTHLFLLSQLLLSMSSQQFPQLLR